MRERQRLDWDKIYLSHLAAARKYTKSLWSAKAPLTSWRHERHRPFKVPCGTLSCERGDDWFSTESICATLQPLGNTLDLFGVRRNSEGTLNILDAREAPTLQSALWDAFMRERRRLVLDGIYLRHLAAARKYARSLWSAKKLRRHY